MRKGRRCVSSFLHAERVRMENMIKFDMQGMRPLQCKGEEMQVEGMQVSGAEMSRGSV